MAYADEYGRATGLLGRPAPGRARRRSRVAGLLTDGFVGRPKAGTVDEMGGGVAPGLSATRGAEGISPMDPSQARGPNLPRMLAVGGLMTVPGAATMDAGGVYPDPLNEGKYLPSMRANVNKGKYFDASLQALGQAGDAASGFGLPGALAGAVLGGPRAIQQALRAARGLSSVPTFSAADGAPRAVQSSPDASIPASSREVLRSDNEPFKSVKSDAEDQISGDNLLRNPDGTTASTRLQKAKASDLRWKEQHPGQDPWVEFTPENAENISDVMVTEALQAANQGENAAQWYSSTLDGANRVVAKMFPEILGDPISRSNFGVIQAITSNGKTVETNARMTHKLYSEFKQTGRFPESVPEGGVEGRQMEQAFRQMNQLVDRLGGGEVGSEKAMQLLNTEFTVAELNKLMGPYGFQVSGEKTDALVMGSAIFGPKIGAGFYQNLMGNFNPLTADRWWMQTWGRITGASHLPMDGPQRAKQGAALLAALRASKDKKPGGYTLKQLEKDPDKLLAVARTFNRRYANGGYEDKSPVHLASKGLAEGQDRVAEAPTGGAHRAFMREAVDKTLTKLRAAGLDISRADLQALLWFPEKDISRAHGIGNKGAAPNDYKKVFSQIAREQGVSEAAIKEAVGGKALAAKVSPLPDRSATMGLLSPPVRVSETIEAVPSTRARGGGSPDLEGMHSAPDSVRANFSEEVSAALRPSGSDVMLESQGIPNTASMGQGAWIGHGGGIENNPLMVASHNQDLNAKGQIPGSAVKAHRASAALKGWGLVQDGSPWHGIMADPIGTSRRYPKDPGVTSGEINAGVRANPNLDAYPLVDTDEGVNLLDLDFGDGITPGQYNAIEGAINPTLTGVPSRNMTPQNKGYIDMSDAIQSRQGSGDMTREMFKDVDKLSPAARKRLESPEVRAAMRGVMDARERAGQLPDIGAPSADVQNGIRIFVEEGFEGLRKALGNKGFIQGVAALGLTGLLAKQMQERGGLLAPVPSSPAEKELYVTVRPEGESRRKEDIRMRARQ